MNYVRSTFALIVLFAAHPWNVQAGGTRIWELAGSAELQKGTLQGTALSSIGEVGIGLNPQKSPIDDDIGVVWSSAKYKNGNIFLGSGYNGKILRVADKEIVHVADTGQLVVTSIAFDKNGDLYAATLPEPAIWKISNPIKIQKGKPVSAEKWIVLPDETKHIWSIIFSEDGNTLFAGTGPDGKIYSIGKNKKPQVYLDTEEDHILTLEKDAKGKILAGTSPSALLLRVEGPGRSVAIADFSGVEVKIIVTKGERIYAAVNDFKSQPILPMGAAATAATAAAAAATTAGRSPASPLKSASGDGELYLIDEDFRQEQLWAQKKQHITSLAIAKNGKIFAGLGADGKIISVDENRQIRYEIDLDERQVMVVVADDDLILAGCGDTGAVYFVDQARKAEAIYLTPLLDASTVAEWGRVTWFASGKLKVQARSGNTLIPDLAWSDWSSPLTQNEIAKAPKARYLQYRFSWSENEKSRFTSIQTAFRPTNLRAVISEFDPGSPFPKPSGSENETTSSRIIDARQDSKAGAELSFSWKVNNPDSDDLRFRLWYRAMGEEQWRPILRDYQVLTALRFTWRTESVPEGIYQIKLEAADSLTNDPKDVLSDIYISPPVLVDNHPPIIKGLVWKNGKISGTSEDSFSSIGALDYSIDNGPWIPILCTDGIFDERKEDFSFVIPSDLIKGPHAAAVRAFDLGGNMGIAEIHFTIK